MTINDLKGKIKKIKLSQTAKQVILQVGIFFLGLILTPIKLAFGIYPFGLALCASCKRYTPFAFAGSILSVIFFIGGSVPYIVALIGILCLRVAGSLIKRGEDTPLLLGERKTGALSGLFCENPFLRVAIGIIGAFGIGLYTVIANGYVYYDVFVLIFMSVVTGIFAYCFLGLFETSPKSRELMLALGALAFAFVYMLSGRELFGIDFSVVLAFAIVLYVSKYISGTLAGAIGLVLGVATDIVFAPVYGLAGVISGLLWGLSPYLSIMSGFVVSMGYGILVRGYEAIVYLAPELLFVSLVMYPLIRFELIPKPSFLRREQRENKAPVTVLAEDKSNRLIKHLREAKGSFQDISAILKDISKKTKAPDRARYRSNCMALVEGYCYNCPKNDICWKNDTRTTEANIFRLADNAFSRGECSKSNVDERFLHRCPHIESIIEEMNKRTKKDLKQQIKNDKLDISATDYELMARLLDGVSKSAQREIGLNNALSDKIVRVLCKNGVVLGGAEVTEGDLTQIILTGIDISRTSCNEDKIKELLEKELRLTLSKPTLEISGGYAIMKLEAINQRKIVHYLSEKSGKEKEISGDVSARFKGVGNREYLLICDGMGSGNEARLTAKLCVDFLEKILRVTSEKELALAMLNNLVRAKNLECSSAIDLLEIDLNTLEGSFIKSGSAPSYIIREGTSYKLQSKTAPVGIMKELDAEKLGFSLREGDVCVMVSDGILPPKGSDEWLVKLLEEKDLDKKSLADTIIKRAKEKNISRDDMSVLVCLVE